MSLYIVGLLFLGFFVGGFGTMVGAGGGFILMPILLFLYPEMPVEVVTSISLCIVFLNATSGSIAYSKMGRIDFKSGLVFGLATLPGAILGVYLTGYVDRSIFDIIMGIMLIIIAGFLFIKPHEGAYSKNASNSKLTQRNITDKMGIHYVYAFNEKLGIILSFFVGIISSFLGIGGGIIHVPALISMLNFPAHIATATSHYVLAIMAFVGTIVHLINGSLQNDIEIAAIIGVGVVIGAQIGARLSNRVKGSFIIQALAIAITIVGIRLIFF